MLYIHLCVYVLCVPELCSFDISWTLWTRKAVVNITMQVEPVSCWYNAYRWWVAQRKKKKEQQRGRLLTISFLFQDTQKHIYGWCRYTVM